MEETFNEIQALVNEAQPDMEKFVNNGTKAAGKRVRKNLMEIIKLAKQNRKEIQETINEG